MPISNQTTNFLFSFFFILPVLSEITWDSSFELLSIAIMSIFIPLSPCEILIDCTSKSNKKCNGVSGKFHLRLLILEIEGNWCRKNHIFAESGGFFFRSKHSQTMETAKPYSRVFVWTCGCVALGEVLLHHFLIKNNQNPSIIYDLSSLLCSSLLQDPDKTCTWIRSYGGVLLQYLCCRFCKHGLQLLDLACCKRRRRNI